MAQPPSYAPATRFATEELNNTGGRSTVRTAAVDAEFTALATTLSAILVNIALNQRDDGQIRDQRVTVASLSTAVVALFTAIGVTVRGAWLTATAYAVKDIVTQGGNTYICATAHTSGVFATDLAAIKWVLLAQTAVTGAFGGIAFTGITDLTTTGNTVLGDASTDTLNVGAGGLVKDASGNVGIGTAAPGTFLDVLKTQNAATQGRMTNASSGASSSATWAVVSDVANLIMAAFSSGSGATANEGWLYSNTATSVVIGTNGARRVTVDSSGNLAIANGKLGPSAAQQHTLPAVASDTIALLAAAQTLTNKTVGTTGLVFSNTAQAGATTLDWYEEGTFTPKIDGTVTGSGTYTTQAGRYQRMGNRVFFQAKIVWTAHTGTGSMFLNVNDLPYSMVDANQSLQGQLATVGSWTVMTQIGLTASSGKIWSVQGYSSGSTGVATAIATTGTLWVSGSYFV